MPKVSMKALLNHAKANQYAVLACNLLNYEMLLGGIKAAEELDAPLILQLAPVQFNTSPLEYFGPIMVDLAEKATVPVVVHLDHGFNIDEIKKSIELGFSSVMIDASSYDFDENVRLTKAVVDIAHKHHVDVEAEIGAVGDESEDYAMTVDASQDLTEPQMALEFVKKTGCDTLAVAIGNAHGLYKYVPKLDIKRLSEINEIVDIPLVLHGGSGTSDADFKECILNGITKINIASSIHKHYIDNLDSKKQPYSKHFNDMIETTKNIVKAHILKFLSSGYGSKFLNH